MFLPVTSILVRSLHPIVRKTNEQTQRGLSLQSTGRVRRVICFVNDVPTGGRRDGAAVCTVASQQEPQARVEFACPPCVCEGSRRVLRLPIGVAKNGARKANRVTQVQIVACFSMRPWPQDSWDGLQQQVEKRNE